MRAEKEQALHGKAINQYKNKARYRQNQKLVGDERHV